MADVRIVAPDPARHREGLLDLCAKTFGPPPYWDQRRYAEESTGPKGNYDWSVSRIAVAVGGAVVAHWGVWGFDMRVGRATVRTGGVGLVATHAEYRKRGYMAAAARASVEAMRDAGYALTMLYGIRDFYHRFGYVPMARSTTWQVKLDDLPEAAPAVRVRRRKRFDLVATADAYNRYHAGLTGTAVRPIYRGKPGWPTWVYLWDEGGRPAGWVVLRRRGDELWCDEAVGDPETVLRMVARTMRREAFREIRFRGLHYDSPVCRRLREGACHAEREYDPRGGAMVRTLNLRAALEAMAGELGRRLKASPMAAWRGTLRVADPRQRVSLVLGRGRVRVENPRRTRHAVRGGEAVAQLLVGTDEVAETVRQGGPRLSGDARHLVPILFPAQHPMLGCFDRF